MHIDLQGEGDIILTHKLSSGFPDRPYNGCCTLSRLYHTLGRALLYNWSSHYSLRPRIAWSLLFYLGQLQEDKDDFVIK